MMIETKLSATETEIALLRRDASWAATHRSELADLRSAFEYAEKKIAAAEEMAKALEECLKDTFTASDGMSECGNLYPKRRYRAGAAALDAWNALK